MTAMAAALMACATTQLSNDVKPYVGRNIHELAAHLGKPNGIRETEGDRVYVWSGDTEGTLPNGLATEGTRTGSTIAHYECTLAVTVNAQDVIQEFEIEGSNAGCAAFRRHLSGQ